VQVEMAASGSEAEREVLEREVHRRLEAQITA
jgi:hypothetical protein